MATALAPAESAAAWQVATSRPTGLSRFHIVAEALIAWLQPMGRQPLRPSALPGRKPSASSLRRRAHTTASQEARSARLHTTRGRRKDPCCFPLFHLRSLSGCASLTLLPRPVVASCLVMSTHNYSLIRYLFPLLLYIGCVLLIRAYSRGYPIRDLTMNR
jgi:hypothetical protein